MSLTPHYGRLVRAELYFHHYLKGPQSVFLRIYHVPTGLTLAADNTGATAWQKMLEYGRRHAEAYEIVLRHGNVIQALEGQFISFATEKELR